MLQKQKSFYVIITKIINTLKYCTLSIVAKKSIINPKNKIGVKIKFITFHEF